MPSIRVKENEPVEVAMRRFKRSCEKAGILTEMRRREYFEKPTEARKRRAAAAVKRHFKRLLRDNPLMMRANGSAKRSPARGEKTGRGERSRSDRNA